MNIESLNEILNTEITLTPTEVRVLKDLLTLVDIDCNYPRDTQEALESIIKKLVD